jgi:hypothetical protein
MSARIVWSGFRELLRELNQLPTDVRAEGHQILVDEAKQMAREIEPYYPEQARTTRGTGRLRGATRVIEATGDVVGAVVKNVSPVSHLWHWGTGQRRTAKGYNRGRMPKANPEPLVPLARAVRRRAKARIVKMLERKGFEVRESA